MSVAVKKKLDGEMLTPSQLAERWDVHVRTLNNWRSQRRGPQYVKLGRGKNSGVLYRLVDIQKFEESHVIKTRAGR